MVLHEKWIMEGEKMPVIAYKQFLMMLDLAAEDATQRSHKSADALTRYQDAIVWPWRATGAQLREWDAYAKNWY